MTKPNRIVKVNRDRVCTYGQYRKYGQIKINHITKRIYVRVDTKG